ncbi:hypothetical protein MZM54_05400 [[Brevibacterium] frigoritolerans]|nr:hypothetical protein [Peribacillus frigoritolerans]
MKLSTEKRLMLSKGLDSLIHIKEMEITKIKQRTEENYSAAKILGPFFDGGFSLEVSKEKDIQKVKNEINELRQLRADIDSIKNHLLIVPNFIQLHLKSE